MTMLLCGCVACHATGVQLFKFGHGYICKTCKKELLSGGKVLMKSGGWIKVQDGEVRYIPPTTDLLVGEKPHPLAAHKPVEVQAEPQLIRTWAELAAIPNESATHRLEVDLEDGNGWLSLKDQSTKWVLSDDITQEHYLSTHTFYGSTYQESSRILQACGFNVVLANWDAQEVES